MKKQQKIQVILSVAFLILVLIVIFAVTSFNNSGFEPQNPENSTFVWVSYKPIQCNGNPWENYSASGDNTGFNLANGLPSSQEVDAIESYYSEKNISIVDLKIEVMKQGYFCEACTCPEGWTLYLKVSKQDAQKLKEDGFKEGQSPK